MCRSSTFQHSLSMFSSWILWFLQLLSLCPCGCPSPCAQVVSTPRTSPAKLSTRLMKKVDKVDASWYTSIVQTYCFFDMCRYTMIYTLTILYCWILLISFDIYLCHTKTTTWCKKMLKAAVIIFRGLSSTSSKFKLVHIRTRASVLRQMTFVSLAVQTPSNHPKIQNHSTVSTDFTTPFPPGDPHPTPWRCWRHPTAGPGKLPLGGRRKRAPGAMAPRRPWRPWARAPGTQVAHRKERLMKHSEKMVNKWWTNGKTKRPMARERRRACYSCVIKRM